MAIVWTEDGIRCHKLNGVCGLCPIHKVFGLDRSFYREHPKRCGQYDAVQDLIRKGIKPYLVGRRRDFQLNPASSIEAKLRHEHIREETLRLLAENKGMRSSEILKALRERDVSILSPEELGKALSLLKKHNKIELERFSNHCLYYLKGEKP